MNTLKKTIVVSGAALIMAACTGTTTPTKDSAAADPYPEWYYSPSSALPNGLSTASCAAIPGNNIDIARQKTITTGRADLANQIESRVKAMAKQYASVTTTNEGDSVDETFENVTKQVANQSLSGARAIKSQRVTDAGKQYFCSLIGLDPTQTQAMIDSMLKVGAKGLSSDQESVLRARFLAEKAQKELENSLK